MLAGRSFQTQVFVMCCVLFALSTAVLASRARAQSPEEVALSKGYNDYFDALMAGKAKNRAEMEKLRDQLIEPAVRSVNRSFDQKWKDAIRSQAQNPPAPRGPEDELLARRLARLKGPERVEADHAEAPEPTLRPIPQPGLDGSKVPKLLEFPPKDKKKSD